MCFFSSSYPLHLFTVCREHNLVSNVKIATRSLFPEVTYIFHCLPWKVVISSQWVNSSRQPSLSASHSGLPNGIQNELLRWGLKKRLQPGGEVCFMTQHVFYLENVPCTLKKDTLLLLSGGLLCHSGPLFLYWYLPNFVTYF